MITFEVEFKAAGPSRIEVLVLSPDGVELSRGFLLVRSTAVNPIALLITIGAGLVLVGLVVEEVVPAAEPVSTEGERPPRDTRESLMRQCRRDDGRHHALPPHGVPPSRRDDGDARRHRQRAGLRLHGRQPHPEHHLRADPRRDPHVGLRPGLRRAHRDPRRGRRPRGGRSRDLAGGGDPRRRRRARCAVRGADHPSVLRLLGRARPRGPDPARRLLPPMVHATDRLLRRRGGHHRTPPGAPAVRGPDVRPDPEQPGRDRDVPRVRGRPRHTGAGGRGDHGPREDHPRRRDDARRDRDDPRAVALAPVDRLPDPAPTRVAARDGPAARASRRVGRALRRRQPARVRGRDHPEQPFRSRPADLHDGVHGVPAPPRDLRRLDLHRVAARHERTVGHRERGRASARSSPVACAIPPS